MFLTDRNLSGNYRFESPPFGRVDMHCYFSNIFQGTKRWCTTKIVLGEVPDFAVIVYSVTNSITTQVREIWIRWIIKTTGWKHKYWKPFKGCIGDSHKCDSGAGFSAHGYAYIVRNSYRFRKYVTPSIGYVHDFYLESVDHEFSVITPLGNAISAYILESFFKVVGSRTISAKLADDYVVNYGIGSSNILYISRKLLC